MVECQARGLEVQGSNPSTSSNFFLESNCNVSNQNYKFVFTFQFDLKILYKMTTKNTRTLLIVQLENKQKVHF